MDADAVLRLLSRREVPVYLTADDLETDKGISDEVDRQLAIDLEEKRKRRAARMIQLKKEKMDLERKGKFMDEEGIKVWRGESGVSTSEKGRQRGEGSCRAGEEITPGYYGKGKRR